MNVNSEFYAPWIEYSYIDDGVVTGKAYSGWFTGPAVSSIMVEGEQLRHYSFWLGAEAYGDD